MLYLCTRNCNFNGFMILDKIDELLKEVQNLSAKNAEEVERHSLQSVSISSVRSAIPRRVAKRLST